VRVSEQHIWRYYPPETYDGTKRFYDWVRMYSSARSVLLNVGAGEFVRREIRSFRGEVNRVIGVDIDQAVLRNSSLDEAHVLEDGILPFPNNNIDLAISDFVMEHVEHPLDFLGEIFRVLKPGSSYLFRTPNRYHYVAMLSSLTPQTAHDAVARLLGRQDDDKAFPTFYRMNTKRDLRRLAEKIGFRKIELKMVETEPSYLLFSRPTFFAGMAYERLVNRFESLSSFRANIFGRFEK
jgi:SAM-dependent methyltransferase